MVYFNVVCPWKYVCDFETAVRMSFQACDQAFSIPVTSPVTIVSVLDGQAYTARVSIY